ncbi:MAG TPA: hypothetical protein PLJ42_04805 [Chitinophagales bacterium]|jgi:hypothetical protein|nr:hypothetical protein [Chitinophagales bacterium]MBP6154082.1 hypothetical protein [Chitinophagales bacterium]HQV78013.1 hypothetical protein [Chitinophagales bacterium]HQW78734.1 hypothetical protein [Chitinophagales bacterium]
MKDLVTVRIVHALCETQEKMIYASLKFEKRTSLLQLFKYLSSTKNDEEISKSVIFLKLFQKKWTKENDYLLRNELKLLKDKIEEIYMQQQLSKLPEKYKNQLKLKLYQQLKITDEYQSVFNKIINYNAQQHELQNTLENSFAYADFIRLNSPNYAERLKLMQANQQLFESTLQQYISEQYSKLCLLKSHVLFQQKQSDNQLVKINFDYDILKIDTNQYRTIFTDYHIAYANAYRNYDTSTIEEWENVYALLQQISTINNYVQNEYCFTLGNLATICSIRTNYEKADVYFSILFKEIPVEITQQNIALTLNYITNLNKLKQYHKCKEEMQQAIRVFGNKIKTFSQFKTQEIVTACYLNEVEKLGTLLAIDFETLQPFERIFYRLFYCIYFLMKDEFDLAFTEIQNLQRSKLMNEIDAHFNEITQFMFVCIKHITANGWQKKFPEKANKEIKTANHKIVQANIPMFLNYTPYVWMKEKSNIENK